MVDANDCSTRTPKCAWIHKINVKSYFVSIVSIFSNILKLSLKWNHSVTVIEIVPNFLNGMIIVISRFWKVSQNVLIINKRPWKTSLLTALALKPEYSGRTSSITWLMTPLLLTLQGHYKSCYWFCRLYVYPKPWNLINYIVVDIAAVVRTGNIVNIRITYQSLSGAVVRPNPMRVSLLKRHKHRMIIGTEMWYWWHFFILVPPEVVIVTTFCAASDEFSFQKVDPQTPSGACFTYRDYLNRHRVLDVDI